MRCRLMAFLVLSALAFGALAQEKVQVPGAAGRWEFRCKDGRLLYIRLIIISPGEITIPLPADLCAPKPARKAASATKGSA